MIAMPNTVPPCAARALKLAIFEREAIEDARGELARAYSFRRLQRAVRDLLVTSHASTLDVVLALAHVHDALTGDENGRIALMHAAAKLARP